MSGLAMRTAADWAHMDAIELAEMARADGWSAETLEYVHVTRAASAARRGDYESAGVTLRAADSLARMRDIDAADLSRAAVALWDERRRSEVA